MVGALILAAGESSRMGEPKALLDAGGEPFLRRIRRRLYEGGTSPVRIVLGHRADEIKAACELPDEEVIYNPNYKSGMLSSLHAGLDHYDLTPALAIVLALVDGPDISPAVVQELVDTYRETNALLVEPVYQGKHGHPILVSRFLFPEMYVADPAQGLKQVVRRNRPKGETVEVDDPGILLDLDTPEEYQAWRASLTAAGANPGGGA